MIDIFIPTEFEDLEERVTISTDINFQFSDIEFPEFKPLDIQIKKKELKQEAQVSVYQKPSKNSLF